MSDAASDSFRRSLEQIADLARRHPDYRFEYIQSYISQLGSEGEVTPWIETLDAQWREMPAPRREACLNMFENALLLALKDAIANPKEAGTFLNQYHREVDADVAAQETQILGSLAQLPGVALGTIRTDRMAKTVDLVKETSSLKRPVNAEDVFSQAI